MKIVLKLPAASFRYSSNGLKEQGYNEIYWSNEAHTSTTSEAWRFFSNSDRINPGQANTRWNEYSVRCFKD
jgi:uncharacterized protein (TIGR02145 family)